MPLHMIKLVVGADTIDDLLAWRLGHSQPGEPWILRTRMTPKRGAEMVADISIERARISPEATIAAELDHRAHEP